jgi:hypothetical protein
MPFFIKCIFEKSSTSIKPEICIVKEEVENFVLNRIGSINSAGAASLLNVSAERTLVSDSNVILKRAREILSLFVPILKTKCSGRVADILNFDCFSKLGCHKNNANWII